MANFFGFKRVRKTGLEDLFFFKKDQEILEKLRVIKKMKETKESLAEVSGIHDDVILQKLVDLNIRPETLVSLSLVPLIEVAWVDGNVDSKEKDAILLASIKLGWGKDSISYKLLERWLDHKPSPLLFESWKHYVESICSKELSPEEIKHFKEEIIFHTREVAETSGGILGIGKISKKEEEMLEKLENAFSVCKLKK